MPGAPSTPRVAVVIVNYRSYPELDGCLSALREDDPTVPVTVVDYEGDPPAASAAGAKFPNATFVPVATNQGFAAGVNRGARATRSDYLLLLNPDSLPRPGLCAALAGWMDAHPRVAVIGPLIENVDGSVQASARRFPDLTTGIAGRSSWLTRVFPGNPLSRHNLPQRATSRGSAPTEVDWVSGACMLVRRQAFDAVGGMDEGFFLYWEDADLCRRLQQAGWTTVYHPGATVLHAGGRSSRHAADASLVAFHRSAYRLFRKHASTPMRMFSPLVFLALRARLALMRRIYNAGPSALRTED